ncbi:hypothetical protein Z043_108919, partial [Scleropages formosus]
ICSLWPAHVWASRTRCRWTSGVVQITPDRAQGSNKSSRLQDRTRLTVRTDCQRVFTARGTGYRKSPPRSSSAPVESRLSADCLLDVLSIHLSTYPYRSIGSLIDRMHPRWRSGRSWTASCICSSDSPQSELVQSLTECGTHLVVERRPRLGGDAEEDPLRAAESPCSSRTESLFKGDGSLR